jgi:hypothetical protein
VVGFGRYGNQSLNHLNSKNDPARDSTRRAATVDL